MVRYTFTVRNFHPLPYASFHRRFPLATHANLQGECFFYSSPKIADLYPEVGGLIIMAGYTMVGYASL
ncbi:MAG: hypothetical protein AB1656_15690 [Candidatus Omnitrophota bacterium]